MNPRPLPVVTMVLVVTSGAALALPASPSPDRSPRPPGSPAHDLTGPARARLSIVSRSPTHGCVGLATCTPLRLAA